MTTTTITPTLSTPRSQLRDDVLEIALKNGFSQHDVEVLEKQLAYRKSYNSRPDVVEKRRLYSQRRYLKMKSLTTLLKGGVA